MLHKLSVVIVKWVKVLANKDNVGFSRANNQAIRESNSEYVLLLNPDTVLQEDSLLKCVAYMDARSEVGALGVRMIDGKGKFLPESKRGLPSPAVALYKMTGLSGLFPKSRIFGRYHLKYLSEHETHDVDVLSGAFMMMRSSALDQVGLLDEDYFMYGEDVDLSYRITLGGYKNVYFAGTTIIHYKGESTKRKSANYVKVFYNAMVLFAQKHYSSSMAGWFAFFIQMAIYLRAGLAFFARLAEPQIRARILPARVLRGACSALCLGGPVHGMDFRRIRSDDGGEATFPRRDHWRSGFVCDVCIFPPRMAIFTGHFGIGIGLGAGVVVHYPRHGPGVEIGGCAV
ncbi:MAG: glycosyltransferase family 2 protein [Bacteroidetes bacterium]|nr:glycosyltransferase family 2 protein [Bacteroidota bacterium]